MLRLCSRGLLGEEFLSQPLFVGGRIIADLFCQALTLVLREGCGPGVGLLDRPSLDVGLGGQPRSALFEVLAAVLLAGEALGKLEGGLKLESLELVAELALEGDRISLGVFQRVGELVRFRLARRRRLGSAKSLDLRLFRSPFAAYRGHMVAIPLGGFGFFAGRSGRGAGSDWSRSGFSGSGSGDGSDRRHIIARCSHLGFARQRSFNGVEGQRIRDRGGSGERGFLFASRGRLGIFHQWDRWRFAALAFLARTGAGGSARWRGLFEAQASVNSGLTHVTTTHLRSASHAGCQSLATT